MSGLAHSFDWSLLGAALCAGLLVISTHVPLGREVLQRGIIFLDLTIAQVAACGAVLVEASGHEASGWALQLASGVAALSAAALLAWSEKRWPRLQEALIGSLYVVAASVAILMLAKNPHGAEHFTHLLAGQILWVSYAQLLPVACFYTGLLLVWAVWARHRRTWFYPIFALTITVSVQLVGVYLVFATLILPALATHRDAGWKGIGRAYGLGAAAYLLGLVLSVPTDLPSGPLIVCALAGLALLRAGYQAVFVAANRARAVR